MSDAREPFLLKDYLMNKQTVGMIVTQILHAYPEFAGEAFKNDTLAQFPELELMERVYCVRNALKRYLSQDYRSAVSVLLKSLPKEADAGKSDNDFGDFIYCTHSYFISEYGCTRKDLNFSLNAIKEFTTRCSAEGAIRFFINAYPTETMVHMKKWTKDPHYHVRRLASEGTRPSLPWAKKIGIRYKEALPLLDELYSDHTRYVTRSVANHVNDISKIDPDGAIELLKKWQKSGRQNEIEMRYITEHALRTLIKDGNKKALALLGYEKARIKVANFSVNTPRVKIGKSLEFSFNLISTSNKPQLLMVDYIVHFRKSNGTLGPKVFKISKKKLKGKETLSVTKKHPMRVMTTRKLYVGKHFVELQINGKSFEKKPFEIVR